MNSRQRIELRALSLVEAVASGRRIEDATVECKATWPEPNRAVRKLAGHANAARGEPILWLIGVDEDAHEIPGAGEMELAEWWAQLERCFDDRVVPDLVSVVVPVSPGSTVVALHFTTDRAPYVVKRQTGSDWSQADVPWRAGNSTRSAHRHELLKMLVPAILAPEADVFESLTTTSAHQRQGERQLEIRTTGSLFFGQPAQSVVVLPDHLMWATVTLLATEARVETHCNVLLHEPRRPGGLPKAIRDGEPPPKSRPLHGVYTEPGATYITGAGLSQFRLNGTIVGLTEEQLPEVEHVDVQIVLPIASSDRRIEIQYRSDRMDSLKPDSLATWSGFVAQQ